MNVAKLVSDQISAAILILRGQRIMLDADLARLYGVSTKALNQAVKRNLARFPVDFMFQLTDAEKKQVVTICDHLASLKFSPVLPFAFTEQGVAMLSSVLRSERAIAVNVEIMRAFVRLRCLIASNKELARRLDELEASTDTRFQQVFEAIRQLMAPPVQQKRPIGFVVPQEHGEKTRSAK
jgi:hypothetical protein